MQKRAKKGTKVEPIPNWTLHDLRRTAKTLMARAGVRPDISERVLGHVIAGVEGTYDRHSYADEKRDALEKLAAMVERILSPLPSNVETLDSHRALSLAMAAGIEAHLAAFEAHKEDLLAILRNMHGRDPKSEPFDAERASRGLTHLAGGFFWRKG